MEKAALSYIKELEEEICWLERELNWAQPKDKANIKKKKEKLEREREIAMGG